MRVPRPTFWAVVGGLALAGALSDVALWLHTWQAPGWPMFAGAYAPLLAATKVLIMAACAGWVLHKGASRGLGAGAAVATLESWLTLVTYVVVVNLNGGPGGDPFPLSAQFGIVLVAGILLGVIVGAPAGAVGGFLGKSQHRDLTKQPVEQPSL